MTEVMPQTPIEMDSNPTTTSLESSSGAGMATLEVPNAVSPDLADVISVPEVTAPDTTLSDLDPAMTTPSEIISEETISSPAVAAELTTPEITSASSVVATELTIPEMTSVPETSTPVIVPASGIEGDLSSPILNNVPTSLEKPDTSTPDASAQQSEILSTPDLAASSLTAAEAPIPTPEVTSQPATDLANLETSASTSTIIPPESATLEQQPNQVVVNAVETAAPANAILGANETALETETASIPVAPESETAPEKAIALQQEIANWEVTAQSLGGELSFAVGAFLGIPKESLKRSSLPEVTVQGEIIPVGQYGDHFTELKNDLDQVGINENDYREPLVALIQMFKGNGLIETDFELPWQKVDAETTLDQATVDSSLTETTPVTAATNEISTTAEELVTPVDETATAENPLADAETQSVEPPTEVTPDISSADQLPTAEIGKYDPNGLELPHSDEFAEFNETITNDEQAVEIPTTEEIAALQVEAGEFTPEQLNADAKRIEDLTKKVATATAQSEARDNNVTKEMSAA